MSQSVDEGLNQFNNHGLDSNRKTNYLGTIEEGNLKVRIISDWQVFGIHFFGKGVAPVICIGYDKGCKGCIKAREWAEKVKPLHEMDKEKRTPDEQKEYEELMKKYGSAKATIRYKVWIIDRTDEKIKIADFNYSVMKAIEKLKEQEQYKFETIPPYDITITKEGKGFGNVKYSVTADREDTPLTEEEEKERAELDSPSEIVDRLKEKIVKDNSIDISDEEVVSPNDTDDGGENVENKEDLPF